MCGVVASGERITIRIRAVFNHHRAEPMVGILIRNRIGMDIYGTNTQIEQIESGPVRSRRGTGRSISRSNAG